jgi:hypothetical protein
VIKTNELAEALPPTEFLTPCSDGGELGKAGVMSTRKADSLIAIVMRKSEGAFQSLLLVGKFGIDRETKRNLLTHVDRK